MPRGHNCRSSGYRCKRSLQRFGLTINQPVKTGNPDKDAQAFVDWQVIGQGHQRTGRVGRTGILANMG